MLSRPIPSNRIAYVDNGRGLLIVMMLLVHAASLCNPPLRDAIQTFWFLDIATCGFITMAGYTFGIVYGPDAAPPLRSVANRALKLLFVMVWSNFLFGAAKSFFSDATSTLSVFTISWLADVTVIGPYNISGVLFPIALQLPLLLTFHHLNPTARLLAPLATIGLLVALMLGFAAADIEDPLLKHLHGLLFGVGLGGFPIIKYLGYGVMGYWTSQVVRRATGGGALGLHTAAGLLAWSLCLFIGFRYLGVLLPSPHWSPTLDLLERYTQVHSLFVVVLGGSILYLRFQSAIGTPSPMIVLGRYALFAFIFHRIVLHVFGLLGMQGGGALVFLFSFFSVLFFTYLACAERPNRPFIDKSLALAGL